MPKVNEAITHIRKHIIAETAETDATQVAGMGERARLALNTVELLRNDGRDLPLDILLQELHDFIPSNPKRASFRRAIINMMGVRSATPWLAIMEWVARSKETRFA